MDVGARAHLTESLPKPPVSWLADQVGDHDEEGQTEVRHGQGEDEPVWPVAEDRLLQQHTQDDTEENIERCGDIITR